MIATTSRAPTTFYKSGRIARTVAIFDNGQTAVFDARGSQIPELQGQDTPERRAAIHARSDVDTQWRFGRAVKP